MQHDLLLGAESPGALAAAPDAQAWPACFSPLGSWDGATDQQADETTPTPGTDFAGVEGEVDCPELLVFGRGRDAAASAPSELQQPSSGESSPGGSSHSSASAGSSCAPDNALERENKRRRNAEAAARYRNKKKASTQSTEARYAELAESHTRLQRERDSLQALNRALESQLAFFQGLFRTTVADRGVDTLPSIHDAAPADEPQDAGAEDGALALDEFLPAGSKRRAPAVPCLAVVFLVVSTIGCEDVLKCDTASARAAPPARPGRALLSWQDEPQDAAHQCSTRPSLSLWALQLQLASPFSAATTEAAATALRLVAVLCLAGLLVSAACSYLAPARQVTRGGWKVSWRKSRVRQLWMAVVGGRTCTSILPSWALKTHSHRA
jgi:hypothetical protein|eukprot:Tamp_08154.p1 GENE.Tamp_08154~~Tamp_08154.p1  ORF type:complete len:389 (+),score=85.15 Tamp_08154:22-1167(+)